MNLIGLLKNVISQPKSSLEGLGILGIALSFWFTPEYTKEILGAIGTLYGAYRLISKDS